MIDLRKIINRKTRGKIMDALWWLPDKPYLQLFYFACEGKFLNFKNPQTFCDKLNWLKIYDKHPEYSRLADKLAVREHIKDVLGEEYIFPIYGQWKSFDELDFNQLPDRFVLKCNHDSGSVKIIKDKNSLSQEEIAELRTFYDRRLSKDFFYAGREYPYKGIDRYIFAEKYMQNSEDGLESFQDYKWMCFNGEPKLMYIETERNVGVKTDIFDMEFNPVDMVGDKQPSGQHFDKPEFFDEMKEIATKLSKGIKFVRIDFRVVDNKVYFGEYTFYDNGGFRSYKPESWDKRLASWIMID